MLKIIIKRNWNVMINLSIGHHSHSEIGPAFRNEICMNLLK